MSRLVPEIGNIVKQYGKFTLRETSVRKEGRVLPSAMLQISLQHDTDKEIRIASIPTRHSELEDTTELLRSWMNLEKARIEQARQLMSETQDQSTREKFQASLNKREPRYRKILQALQEIDPEYQPDESGHE